MYTWPTLVNNRSNVHSFKQQLVFLFILVTQTHIKLVMYDTIWIQRFDPFQSISHWPGRCWVLTDISRYSAENFPTTFSHLCFSYYQVIVRQLATDNRGRPVRAQDSVLYRIMDMYTYENAQMMKPQLVPYIAAEFHARDFDRYQSFVVGDGSRSSKVYEDTLSRRRKREESPIVYYNGPLEKNTFYAVFQRAYVNKVSIKGLPQTKNKCVSWRTQIFPCEGIGSNLTLACSYYCMMS